MRVVERNGGREERGREERGQTNDAASEKRAAPVVIERESTCPTLIRVFCGASHHRPDDYNNMNETAIANELHIYTWMDATLREITGLVQDANEDARKSSRLAYSIVFPDRRGKYTLKKAGVVGGRKPSPDEDKTLAGLGFQSGDFLDVAMFN
ncbi:hypothetical protein THRCLA_23340 [Thraustotheca clavata]|uniref:Histone deacetylase complex subunit SAP18 n=1 Tax=Thraustotheca clavata TaxID=74557 RepID=A0A1V9Y767_9STRA|nr:hypothetical protein THRCLA_23340 [Thraustotheca clavata]